MDGWAHSLCYSFAWELKHGLFLSSDSHQPQGHLLLPSDAEQAHCETKGSVQARATIMTQNRGSESQNDHQGAKKEDGLKANACNELLKL